MNAEISAFYYIKKKSSVRKGILPGSSKSLWTAVKLAKDVGAEHIPTKMNLKGIPVEGSGISDCFAKFFDEKIKSMVEKVVIDNDVYNGKVKMVAGNLDFMTKSDIISCIKMLKVKNCEGYDRIPQRVLVVYICFFKT